MATQIEVRRAGQVVERIAVEREVDVGREGVDLVLDDPAVSRRHLRIEVTADGLSVTDLGSSNGTKVNGVRIGGTTHLHEGDVVGAGGTELVVLATQVAARPTDVSAVTPVTAVASATDAAESPGLVAVPGRPGPPTPVAAAPRPALADLARLESDAVVVRFRPGSAGEQAAPAVLAAAKRARRRLAGLGSEPWGGLPQICLVDPFPDPSDPSVLVTAGTVVDVSREEIWMVVTPEAPAEPPGRALALLFGAMLPAGEEVAPLLEGYGLWVDDTADADDHLRGQDLPPLAAAAGELRPAMAGSFVRFLIGREGEDGLRRLLGTARPGRVDEAARDVFGAGMGELELAWRQELAHETPSARPMQFLRLSLRYLRPYWGRQLEIFFYMLLGLAFTTLFPFITRHIFDKSLPSGELSEVTKPLALLAGAFVVSLLAGVRRAYVTASVSQAVVRDVRTEMFGKLQDLSTSWFTRHQQGDVLGRMFTDVEQVEQGLSRTLAEGIFQILSLVVSSVIMLRLNLWLGLLVLAGSPVVGLVYRAMGAGARRRSLAVQEESGRLMGLTAENYAAQPVVKLFGLRGRERDRFERVSGRLYRAERRMSLFGGLFGLSVNTIVTILRLAVLGIGVWLILEGRFTIGGLVAFMGVMGEVLNPVTLLTGIGQALQAATGSLIRVNEILDEPPEVVDDPDAVALGRLGRELRLDAVSFSYTTERQTLHHIDALIPAGSRVAFVGPSGSGKSTVLRLLMRLYDPDEGAISIDGHDIRRAHLRSLRDQIGVVFQDTFLFNTTIRENIALGRPGASDAEVEAAAQAAEVDSFIADLSRGYDTSVGEAGALLSGGQRQRIAIARALIRNPRLLLLDEATSALDPRTERQIVTTLNRAGAGRTTVAITHRLTSVVDYDLIFVLVDGTLVERGTHQQLLDADGAYARLWAEQTGEEVPATAPVETGVALARVPLFSGLATAELAQVAQRLRAFELVPGARLPEGGGRMVLLARGRAQVLSPSIDGELVATAELGPGGSFGVRALLGQETGALLEAVEPTTLLELDDEAITALAARFPAVRAALAGTGLPSARPAEGRRLVRHTFGPTSTIGPVRRAG
jgi:ABC-type multidrug transport system fused ATPase/permease subunit